MKAYNIHYESSFPHETILLEVLKLEEEKN